MPGQRGTEKRRMGGQVLVRLPDELAASLDAAAVGAGLTAAAWARARLAEALAAAPEVAVPVRAYRKPKPPAPAHVIEIARLREVVAELSGALVQAAIRTREAGRADMHAEIEATIPGVRAAVRELDGLKRALLEEAAG